MTKLNAIRQLLVQEGVDVFLASRPTSRRYLTGFTGSAGLVWIGASTQRLVTDFRYIEQATNQAPDFEIVLTPSKPSSTLAELIAKDGVKKIAIEAANVTVEQFRTWEKELSVELVPVSGWVENLQLIKSSDEIDCLREAASIADMAFDHILPFLKVGAKERDIALELEVYMRKSGASAISFNPIVGSGANGAIPHHSPGENELKRGDLLVLDFGCVYKGYCSDMTRTVCIEEATEKGKEIYAIVLEAQLKSLEALEVGQTCSHIDEVARTIITDKGYGDYFGHNLGHGVGLDVHEGPRLSKLDVQTLKPGMVVTIEPGIYLPGFGGVRIEDLVVLTPKGKEILSKTTKELIVTG